MAPSVLRRRTEATAVVYGAEANGLLHPEIQSAVGRRVDVLKALGVGGEPTTADLVGPAAPARRRVERLRHRQLVACRNLRGTPIKSRRMTNAFHALRAERQ
jgi:hypothetical protein